MRKKSVPALAAVAAIGLVFAIPSHAQPRASASVAAARPAVQVGNWYGGLEIGAIISEDIAFRESGIIPTGPLAGVPLTYSEKDSYDTGVSVGPFLGYHFNEYLAAEADFFYSRLDVDKATIHFTRSGIPGTFSNSVSGHTDAESLFANGVVSPLGRSRFTPYLGGGIGFTNLDQSGSFTLRSVSIGGTTVPINTTSSVSDSEFDFATDAVAGFNWAATDRVSLGARYRFLWVSLQSPECSTGFRCSQGDLMAHILSANVTYHF